MTKPELSVVIPLYCEEDNVPLLVDELAEALSGVEYELILVDDGSDDATFEKIKAASEQNPRIIGVQLRRNFGQTAAMSAGFRVACGEYVAYMDGDLQMDPEDILRLLDRLKRDHLDLVNGWRQDRKDAGLSRRLPSRIANTLIRWSTGVRLHDYGCPMKVMRQDVAKHLRLYGEQHRFLPVMAVQYGARLGEQAVTHRPRRFGESKYGLGRTLDVLVDLLLVMFFQRFTDRPLQLFGPVGLASFFTGFAIDLWLSVQKILFGAELASRPMLQFGSLLIVSGLLLFGIGLIMEMQVRIYYALPDRAQYSIRTSTKNLHGRAQEE